VWLRGETIRLTGGDRNVLRVLLRHDGRCSMELMMVEGWEGGYRLEGMEAAVKRLQVKIGEAQLDIGGGLKGDVRLKDFEVKK
jgi:hypothetical protein